ncbi:MAG TPA: Smr/MutS family protein [Xanthobacteraceae bacterium]
MSRRELSEEEHELWRSIARSLKPLRKRAAREKDEAKIAKPEPVASPRAAKPARSAKAVRPSPPPAKSPGPPRLAPLARREKQKIVRGRAAIDARIDLHGMTQAQAHAALARFLRRAQHDGAKFALVVTGKGTRSADAERGVLRRQVPHWLHLPELRDIVLGFEEAHITHGGEGALYVRLRRVK